MGLAVAGLKKDEFEQRRRKLASGDWSGFTPPERLAFQAVVKLTQEPAKFSQKDYQALTDMFGKHRAIDVIFYAAWGNYMTRVGDAFQLPLEREDPFVPPKKPDPPAREK